MSFTAEQRQALIAKLDGRFEGWDWETVALRCIWEGPQPGASPSWQRVVLRLLLAR